jgi:hypothetical protein
MSRATFYLFSSLLYCKARITLRIQCYWTNWNHCRDTKKFRKASMCVNSNIVPVRQNIASRVAERVSLTLRFVFQLSKCCRVGGRVDQHSRHHNYDHGCASDELRSCSKILCLQNLSAACCNPDIPKGNVLVDTSSAE